MRLFRQHWPLTGNRLISSARAPVTSTHLTHIAQCCHGFRDTVNRRRVLCFGVDRLAELGVCGIGTQAQGSVVNDGQPGTWLRRHRSGTTLGRIISHHGLRPLEQVRFWGLDSIHPLSSVRNLRTPLGSTPHIRHTSPAPCVCCLCSRRSLSELSEWILKGFVCSFVQSINQTFPDHLATHREVQGDLSKE